MKIKKPFGITTWEPINLLDIIINMNASSIITNIPFCRAIPILVDDNSNQNIKGFNETAGPFFSSLYNNVSVWTNKLFLKL